MTKVKRIIQDRLGEAPLHAKKLEPKTVPRGTFGATPWPRRPFITRSVSSHPSSSILSTTTTTTSDLPFKSSTGSGPLYPTTEEPGLLDYPTLPLFPVIDPNVEGIREALNAGNFDRVAAIISGEKLARKLEVLGKVKESLGPDRVAQILKALQKQLTELQSVLSILGEE